MLLCLKYTFTTLCLVLFKENLLSMEPWPAAKKNLVSVAVPPAPLRVPSQRPLAPRVTSVTMIANDKRDNEIILGAVHRSPGICPRKPQLGDCLMKVLCDLSSPQMGSFPSK